MQTAQSIRTPIPSPHAHPQVYFHAQPPERPHAHLLIQHPCPALCQSIPIPMPSPLHILFIDEDRYAEGHEAEHRLGLRISKGLSWGKIFFLENYVNFETFLNEIARLTSFTFSY